MDWLLSTVSSLITIGEASYKGVRRLWPTPPPTQSNQPQPVQADIRRIPCRYCGTSGRVLVYHDRRQTNFETCGICYGLGDVPTRRWNQPDCNYCGGGGSVITHRSRFQTITNVCPICSGIGKRPLDSELRANCSA
jgi:hypothetical protein